MVAAVVVEHGAAVGHQKEELVGGKKKGRTWGPSSTLQKERAGGEERYECIAASHPIPA